MQSDTLEKILNIGESFFTATKAKDLLQTILSGAKQICDAERATLFLSENPSGDGKEVLRSYVATDIGGQIKEIKVESGLGIVGHSYKTREAQIVDDVEDSPYFNPKIDELTQFKTVSILSVPLIDHTDSPFGVIQVLNKRSGKFDENDLKKVKVLALLAISALRKIEDDKKMKSMKKKIDEYTKSNPRPLVLETRHNGLRKIYEKMKVVSKSNSSVLLLGESGTGKEVMARLIHEQSDRRNGPFVAVNCAAIPKALFEAELFGIKKGTATGVEEREGLFQKANGGTLFFDEIGEMPYDLQSKLLRVLQEKKVSRIGDNNGEQSVDFRFVSATNRNLKESINEEGIFREDLFFRINVFEFHLPPLRERIFDIDSLARDLAAHVCREQNYSSKTLNAEALEKLRSYSWPGNIRELKNVLERACVLAQNKQDITSKEILLPSDSEAPSPIADIAPSLSVVEEFFGAHFDMNQATKKFQKAYAMKVITSCKGNKSQAAKDLKLSREGLRKILKRDVA